jgi:formylglycine-generating enzyme required for sulfatase activity
MRRACGAAVFVLVALVAAGALAQPAVEGELTKGVRQIEDGYLEDGVTTLERVVRRLSAQPARSQELAQAYLYLGIAHAQMDTEKSARASFREALKLDPGLTLVAARWPPKVLRAFTAIRSEVVPPSPSSSPAGERIAPLPSVVTRGPKPGQGAVNPKDGLEYVWVPPGTFQMGCIPWDSACRADEKPRHSVTISRGLWAGRTEVTVGAFGRFVGQTGYRTTAEREGSAFAWRNGIWDSVQGASWRVPGFSQDEAHPVVTVSWHDAAAYCAWSGGRLPTEAEWEYMARGGREDAIYPWEGGASHETANYGQEPQCSPCGPLASGTDRWEYTAPVGRFPANGFGQVDVAGNVWEWTADWYGEGYYGDSSAGDPAGPISGHTRVLRGGGWFNPSEYLRVSDRDGGEPGAAFGMIGFRCARDLSP